jgi:hypothetical protein
MSKKYKPKDKKTKIKIRPTDKQYEKLRLKELEMILDKIAFFIQKPLFRG